MRSITKVIVISLAVNHLGENLRDGEINEDEYHEEMVLLARMDSQILANWYEFYSEDDETQDAFIDRLK